MAGMIERATSVILVSSAVVVAGVALHREFAGPRSHSTVAVPVASKTFMAEWNSVGRLGEWIGDSNARVRIVEFGDFECPFCRRFQESFEKTRRVIGKDVALLFIEYPLTVHRFAKPAAYAAECAAKQGRWTEFHGTLFAKQDSFGLKSWASYAAAAGISDTVTFNRCVATMTTAVRVDSALAFGKTINLRGTPTVIIDGWRYSSPPYDSLLPIVQAELKNSSRVP